MSPLRHTVERLRQPAYTGPNRCLPCTTVNAAIAAAVAVVVGVVWHPVGGGMTFAVCLAVIYLRGYLVPGTPELTKRYVPGRLLRLFGKESLANADDGTTPEGRDAETAETETLLRTAGVVEPEPEADDLRLTDEFREVWWRRIRQFRDDEERAARHLASVLDVDPAALGFVGEAEFGVSYEGDLIAEWVSEAAFYADLAAEPTLVEWLNDWDDLGDRRRTNLLAGLRAFLERCPACDAELQQVENVRQSCCTSDLVSVSVDCESCGARVFSGSYR